MQYIIYVWLSIITVVKHIYMVASYSSFVIISGFSINGITSTDVQIQLWTVLNILQTTTFLYFFYFLNFLSIGNPWLNSCFKTHYRNIFQRRHNNRMGKQVGTLDKRLVATTDDSNINQNSPELSCYFCFPDPLNTVCLSHHVTYLTTLYVDRIPH